MLYFSKRVNILAWKLLMGTRRAPDLRRSSAVELGIGVTIEAICRDECQGIAPPQISPYPLVQGIVVQEMIELSQHQVGVLGEFRHTGKHVFIGIAIDEHGSTSSSRT
jgi:hypothetical protein